MFRVARVLFIVILFLQLPLQADAAQPEMRGICMHATQMKTPGEADACIAKIAAADLNAVIPLVWYWGGQAAYKSRLCPMLEGVETGFDPLGYLIRECHKRNIEVHAWFVNGSYGNEEPLHLLDKHPDWVVDAPGRLWYDFGRPEVRRFQSDLMIECLENYDLDGILFDYIRYDIRQEELCKHCLAEFAKQYGYAPIVTDAEVDALKKDARKWRQWMDFRKQGVTQLVRDVYRRAKAIKPQAQVTAAVFTPLDRAEAAYQDWPGWLREGIIDFVLPMAYTANNKLLEDQIKQWRTLDPEFARIAPILCIYQRTSSGIKTREIDLVMSQQDLCDRHGAHARAYFSLQYLSQPLIAAMKNRSRRIPTPAAENKRD